MSNWRAKGYDLEERTFIFAKRCRELVKQLPKTISNLEDGKQLIRSSGSVHGNYVEYTEALSKKDALCRLKISRKETKESHSWLRLLDDSGVDESVNLEREDLVRETTELMKIFGSIITKKQ